MSFDHDTTIKMYCEVTDTFGLMLARTFIGGGIYVYHVMTYQIDNPDAVVAKSRNFHYYGVGLSYFINSCKHYDDSFVIEDIFEGEPVRRLEESCYEKSESCYEEF